MRNVKLEEDIALIDDFIGECWRDFPIGDVAEAWAHVKEFVGAKEFAMGKDIVTEEGDTNG